MGSAVIRYERSTVVAHTYVRGRRLKLAGSGFIAGHLFDKKVQECEVLAKESI